MKNILSSNVINGDAERLARYDAYLPARSSLPQQALPWIVTLLTIVILPFLFSGAQGISVLTQMGITITFALAYNMLLGGTGLLSFGHALYFGIGSYVTAHMLNAFAGAIPLILLPLAGGAVALVVGAVLALFTVRHDKTTYAMISLAIGQLAFAAATIMPGWSGGDSGIRLDPSSANGWGIDFGDPLALYFLIAGWAWLCALAMFSLNRTPLGRLMNATRDNSGRIAYVGFSPIVIRGMALTLSAGFAGIAGALYALFLQVVTTDTFGLPQTTVVMLQTYIGGFTSFLGPVLGAGLMTLVAAHLSTLTEAWPLYLGAFFMIVVICTQHGLVGAIVTTWNYLPRAWRKHGPGYVIQSILAHCICTLLIVAGLIGLIEMIQSWSQNDAAAVTILSGSLAFQLDPHIVGWWVSVLILLLLGMIGMKFTRKRYT